MNLDQTTAFGWGDIATDGRGNVIKMPLLRRKPCFGRPERWCRGGLEISRSYLDESGARHFGKTRCDKCPVFDACSRLCDERLHSAPDAHAAFHKWLDYCEKSHIPTDGIRAFVGVPGKHWQGFLDAIIQHGGWNSSNDQNIKLHDRAQANAKRERRKEHRQRKKALRQGAIKPITSDFLKALDVERNRRVNQLNDLKHLSSAGPSITRLDDMGRSRIGDVWTTRETLKRRGKQPTGANIARAMIAAGRDYGLRQPSLNARVCEDLKRIDDFEHDYGGGPIWSEWDYSEP